MMGTLLLLKVQNVVGYCTFFPLGYLTTKKIYSITLNDDYET